MMNVDPAIMAALKTHDPYTCGSGSAVDHTIVRPSCGHHDRAHRGADHRTMRLHRALGVTRPGRVADRREVATLALDRGELRRATRQQVGERRCPGRYVLAPEHDGVQAPGAAQIQQRLALVR
jgi:hypothetical protein